MNGRKMTSFNPFTFNKTEKKKLKWNKSLTAVWVKKTTTSECEKKDSTIIAKDFLSSAAMKIRNSLPQQLSVATSEQTFEKLLY